MDKSYQEFLKGKRTIAASYGKSVSREDIHGLLFPFQVDLTTWAARKGRAAIFADTGLGKTLMQLEWAHLIGEKTLIIAPLTVARQTVREGTKIGVQVHYTRSGDDLNDGINITNYEMLDHFDAGKFNAVVLDESSILKSLTSKTRQKLIEMFADTPYRLCCTATPAPNDIAEIANHAEFLGIMNRADMLATYFVHDDNSWRLKGHAVKPFYRWMASWGMSISKPSDLGYEDDGFILPPLEITPVFVKTGYCPEGQLMFTRLSGIQDRASVRKATVDARVNKVADMVSNDGEQWIIWCGLNDEQDMVHDLIPDSVSVFGSMSPEDKMTGIEAFQDGTYRVLVTKPSIAGFGMNLQNCHKMAFLGLSDSWEAYYQCIRRCYRFGQHHPVEVHIVLADVEDAIYANIQAKEAQAMTMRRELIANVQEYEREEIGMDTISDWTYEMDTAEGDGWKLMLGDSAERMAEIPDESIDLSVFSPPFESLYTYSPTERDLGNSRTSEEFFEHFGFVIDHLLRITKPGRNCCVHAADIPAMLVRDGYIGLKDFPGKIIEAFEARGWIYHGRVAIDKDPQAQAIRTKSKALLFTQMHKDSSWSRPALADYILIFRKPGNNEVPITPDISNDEWIEWARPIWYGIKESDTLQYREAREAEDERHICPLQLSTIERCIRLWSNPGETVCSPFAGIGSEGYESIKCGRHFVGCELKRSYFDMAVKNLQIAVSESKTPTLFDYIQATS